MSESLCKIHHVSERHMHTGAVEMSSNVTYCTEWEVDYLNELFRNNRRAFIGYAGIVLEDRRSFDGDGMNVNVNIVKSRIRELLRKHLEETDIPPAAAATPESRNLDGILLSRRIQ